MKKNIITMTIIVFFIFSAVGCGKKTVEISPEVATSDEALFRLGEEFIKKDPEKGRLYLRQVIDSFPKSFFAQRAKLAIADSYFDKGDEGSMLIASSEYREFITLYPYSPSAPYAQYQIALTFFKKALKPGRDQTKTRQALIELKKVITTYNTSEESELAKDKINECEERLAAHTFSIGEHYYKVHAYKASVDRLTEILTEYPNYSKMEKVYYILGDNYLNWNKNDEAVPFFRKLISDYPKSKLAKKAIKKIESIENKEK